MTDYTTETGYYVVCEADGRVLAKSDVPKGTHPVDKRCDLSKSNDVDSQDALSGIKINDYYSTNR